MKRFEMVSPYFWFINWDAQSLAEKVAERKFVQLWLIFDNMRRCIDMSAGMAVEGEFLLSKPVLINTVCLNEYWFFCSWIHWHIRGDGMREVNNFHRVYLEWLTVDMDDNRNGYTLAQTSFHWTKVDGFAKLLVEFF